MKTRIPLVLALLLMIATLLVGNQPGTTGAAENNVVTLTPAVIPHSDPEIPNPFRGEYLWNEVNAQPAGWPIMDVYERDSIYWRIIEPTQGNYDFSKIDQALADAKARGGKLGIRIMGAGTGFQPIEVPDYIKTGAGGSWVTVDGAQWWIPNWNNEFYLSRLEALMKALGDRYRDDPRLGFVDIGVYGNWGEWHNWPYGLYDITTANAHRIIKANVDNFPDKHIVAITSSSLSTAMQYPTVGLRSDCLGETDMMGHETNLIQAGQTALDRWKTAPYITEWCWGSGGATRALSQVKQYHISMLSSGNTVYPAGNAVDFQMAIKMSGYRYVLDSLALPQTITSGQPFTTTAQWSNVNVAPTYEPWDVMLQLRKGTTVVWQGKSSLDLRKLLPGSQTITDSFTLPNIPAGTYDVAVRVLDPTNYYKPLNLAIRGKQADGSYVLGQVQVTEDTNNPPPPTPSVSVTSLSHQSSTTSSPVTVNYTLQTTGSLGVESLIIAARDASGANYDFPAQSNVTLSGNQSFTSQRSIPAGRYTYWIAYYKNGVWTNLSPTQSFTITASVNGLKATYYNNKDFTGTTYSRIDPTIDFNWNAGSPHSTIAPDTFSARWVGKVVVPSSGKWTFQTNSNDGVRLWVNGQLLINNWTNHQNTKNTGSITLTANQKYDIKLEFYDNSGGAFIKLKWSGPGVSSPVTIPSSRLWTE